MFRKTHCRGMAWLPFQKATDFIAKEIIEKNKTKVPLESKTLKLSSFIYFKSPISRDKLIWLYLLDFFSFFKWRFNMNEGYKIVFKKTTLVRI